MASGPILPPAATTYSAWEYSAYPHDDPHPEYIAYAHSRLPPGYTQHQQVYQVWTPPSPYSTSSYPDPSVLGSPAPLGHSLTGDPAFAPDPSANPNYWYHPVDVQSTTPFPTRSYSGLEELPRGFVAQSGPASDTSRRAQSYHDDVAAPSSPPQSYYFVPPSVSASSSASGSSVSNSSINRPPRSSVRNSDYARDYSDPQFRSIPPMETSYALPDEAQPRPRTGKHRVKRRSPHAAQPANGQAEESGPVVTTHTTDGSSHTLMSSMTVPPPPGLVGEPSKDGRARTRTSSRATPPDLDPVDQLDATNPYGINVHHKGPYEAVAAILNDTNPIDSPLLQVKGMQKQVSAARVPTRPSRHSRGDPSANPMALNLQPGQILQSSIYQPVQPSHFPPEFSLRAHPSNRDIRPARGPAELTTADHDAATATSPLRRNQTLPAASLARGPPEQSYMHPPVTSEAQAYQRSYPTDAIAHQPVPPPSLPVDGQNNAPPRSSGRRHRSYVPRHPPEPPYTSLPSYSHPSQSTGIDYSTGPLYADASHNARQPLQLAPVDPAAPPGAPPTPDLDLRFSRTLYLTNPDETSGNPGHRTQPSPLSRAPETSGERQSGRSSRSHRNDGQPSFETTVPMGSEAGRRGPSRSSLPGSTATPDQDSPRRYEPPSHTIAPINAQYLGQAASATSSSSRTSSSLAPRHRPRHLVMPTPLADASESAPLTAPSVAPFRAGNPTTLRKRQSGVMARPQRAQSLPPQTVSRGVFSFFKFGKGSKPTVREVRVTERPKVGGDQEKGQQRVRIREPSRKLSKRR